MFGSRIGSCVVVSPPGTVPAGCCGTGVAAGTGVVPGGAVGLVRTGPGGAVGFCGTGFPGIGVVPGGRVGSPCGGVGRGVCCGVCATAAVVPTKTMPARTTVLTNV